MPRGALSSAFYNSPTKASCCRVLRLQSRQSSGGCRSERSGFKIRTLVQTKKPGVKTRGFGPSKPVTWKDSVEFCAPLDGLRLIPRSRTDVARGNNEDKKNNPLGSHHSYP